MPGRSSRSWASGILGAVNNSQLSFKYSSAQAQNSKFTFKQEAQYSIKRSIKEPLKQIERIAIIEIPADIFFKNMDFGCFWGASGRCCSKMEKKISTLNCHKWGGGAQGARGGLFKWHLFFRQSYFWPRQCRNCLNNLTGNILLKSFILLSILRLKLPKSGQSLKIFEFSTFQFVSQYHWGQHYFHWSYFTFKCCWPHFSFQLFSQTLKCRFPFLASQDALEVMWVTHWALALTWLTLSCEKKLSNEISYHLKKAVSW